MTAESLHLVREKEPDVPEPVQRVYCFVCADHVYVIHLDREIVDP